MCIIYISVCVRKSFVVLKKARMSNSKIIVEGKLMIYSMGDPRIFIGEDLISFVVEYVVN